MRSTSTIASTTISRRTTTIVLNNTKTGVRIGSITPSTGGMPSTGIRERLRSMGSNVPVPEPGRPHQTHGATAVVQVKEGAEGLKSAIAVVAEAAKVLLADLTGEEASAPPATAAQKVVGLLPAALEVPGAVVDRAAVAAEAPEAVAAVVEEAADAGNQEREIIEKVMRTKG